jgi:ribosomal protein S27E
VSKTSSPRALCVHDDCCAANGLLHASQPASATWRPGRPATGPLALLLATMADPPAPEDQERVARARRLLEEAIARGRQEGPGTPRNTVGLKVDKYFGDKLPPVCAKLGCYVTDDGKRFYCVNPACQKHKKRETKHTRHGNPAKAHFVYFKCPRCQGKNVEMSLMSNKYACRACKYVWDR